MTATGQERLDAYVASLELSARERPERVSLRLDELPRHETMDVLEPADGRAHFDAMIDFGAELSRACAPPFGEPPPIISTLGPGGDAG